MTEFNSLLKNTKFQVSLTDSSEQEDDSSKPLLRKKIINAENQVRYRPKSMSMIARSNYSSSEFRNSTMSSSMTITQSVTSSKTTSRVNARPQSYTETSTQKVQVSDLKAEKFFIKSVDFSSATLHKSSSSATNISVTRPIPSSEPLYIQDIPSDPVHSKPMPAKEVKIEVKERTSPVYHPPTPSPALTESNRTSSVETDEHSQVVQEATYSEEASDTSSSESETSSNTDHASDATETHATPPLQQQPFTDLQYSPIIPGKESSIEINRGLSDLGINIIGGANTLLNSIHILTVLENGAAAKDGRLWPGDRILSANGRDLRFAAHEDAIEVIRNSPPQVRMIIYRDEEKCFSTPACDGPAVLKDGSMFRSKRFLKYQRKIKIPLLAYWDSINNEKETDIYNVYEVELKKKGNQSLGLCIIGRRNDPGVFVTEVTPGGAAEKDGSISRGDQILAINGIDIKIAGQDKAAEMVKESRGKIHLKMGRLKSGIPDDLMDMPINEDRLKSSKELGNSFTVDQEKKLTRFVEIAKPYNTALGVFIAGGVGSPLGDVPVFVAMIEETNVVGAKLKIGDIIVSVNGQTTEHKTHDEVVAMMSTEDDMIILMQVREPTEEIEKLSSYLTQAVQKSQRKKSTLEREKRKSLERQQNIFDFSSAQSETLVF